MATVVTFDDLKAKPRDTPNGVSILGGRDKPDLPFAIVATYRPGRYSRPHYHNTDQFQIVIDGKGKMGRHDIHANSVHFARAYTPYGPFTADEETGLTCLIIRAHPDTGSLHSMGELNAIPNRHPWQITRDIVLPALEASGVSLQQVPEICNDQGLATYKFRMRPDAAALTPNPSNSDGQFVVILEGGLRHEQRVLNGLVLAYVPPQEGAFEIHAGGEGLAGLIVQFPRLESYVANVGGSERREPECSEEANKPYREVQCLRCGFVYAEADGLPEDGIAPGTSWEDVPQDWSCPDCFASKAEFS